MANWANNFDKIWVGVFFLQNIDQVDWKYISTLLSLGANHIIATQHNSSIH